VSERFEREVIDRLARIEEHVGYNRQELADHIEDSDEKFEDLGAVVVELKVESAVAKKVGGRAGALTGAGTGAAILTLVETAKAWLAGS
jgi:mevalonate kinase